MQWIRLTALIIFPAILTGVEFYSSVLQRASVLAFEDSIPVFTASVMAFRGYPETDIGEGGFNITRGKERNALGLNCRFQFHELLSSQAFSVLYRRKFSDLLMGELSGRWFRTEPQRAPPCHELSLSWRLRLHPAPWLNTTILYEGEPSLAFPDKRIKLTSPWWGGYIRFIVPNEGYISAGVICTEHLYPDWLVGLGFYAGTHTALSMSWFNLSRSLNATLKIQYLSWTFTWIVRWHPLLGLSGGSVFSYSV